MLSITANKLSLLQNFGGFPFDNRPAKTCSKYSRAPPGRMQARKLEGQMMPRANRELVKAAWACTRSRLEYGGWRIY